MIEMARILAGPWIGQTLADLGAEVIKLESPDGDDTRNWGPPFVKRADGSDGDAAYFHSTNRGKKSVVVDFKTEEGRDIQSGRWLRTRMSLWRTSRLAAWPSTASIMRPCVN